MNYPLISEYIDAILNAEDNFATLTNLRPVLGDDGRPFMCSGNFAAVFKMKDIDSGKEYAVKCFTKEEERREESYRLIAEELENVQSPYLTSVRYLEKELFVDTDNSAEEEFPVLLMDWVEGKTLDVYLREVIDDDYERAMLAYNFCKLAAWLLTQPFAHGDLKPDNILVREDGSLVLVDYDGMYVPAMQGEKSRELGSPDYRHPLRTEDDFNEHIDDFAIASIALSLKAIALKPSFLEELCAQDRLLFSAADYSDLGQCHALQVLTALSSDAELTTLLALFLLAHSKKSLSAVSFRLFTLSKTQKAIKTIKELLSTEVTAEDITNGWEDEHGVVYSKDRKRLLKCKDEDITAYTVRKGTKVIGNGAFYRCANLESISLPKGITSIGNSAFYCCENLESISLLEGITSIGDSAFDRCINLTSISLPKGITSIGNSAFYCCMNLASISLPEGITSIGDMAFSWCENLESISLPKTLRDIKENPFTGCHNLHITSNSPNIIIEKNLLIHGNTIVAGIGNKSEYNIPSGITSIGNSAFYFCENLESISLPEGITSIGDYVFGCKNLASICITCSNKSDKNAVMQRFKEMLPSNLHDIIKIKEQL